MRTECGPDAETAALARHWHELRWRIERFFNALKKRTPNEDRRLNEAGRTGAGLRVAHVDIDMVRALAARRDFKVTRGPPDLGIRTFAPLAAGRQAGFHPSNQLSRPGRRKVREGLKIFSISFAGHNAVRELKRGNERRKSYTLIASNRSGIRLPRSSRKSAGAGSLNEGARLPNPSALHLGGCYFRNQLIGWFQPKGVSED